MQRPLSNLKTLFPEKNKLQGLEHPQKQKFDIKIAWLRAEKPLLYHAPKE